MSTPLDILALEPFYGGPRKAMLDTLIGGSRHRWTLLKLPPRRIERRLAAAAHWFAEQLSMHWPGNIDLIFASEALNLADLYRLVPGLTGKPSVVYFHSNQLSAPGGEDDINAPAAPSVLANLSTAAAASELWFNTACHQRTFFERAQALMQRHMESFSRNPLEEIARKCRIMPPPTDLNMPRHVQTASSVQRDKRTIFVETRDASRQLLNEAFMLLRERGEKFRLITVGPVEGLSDELPRATVPEMDDFGVVQGMLKCGMYISGRADAMWDHRLLMAMAAGCWPIVPMAGFYADLIAPPLDERCLYDCTAEGLAYLIQDFWEMELPKGHDAAIRAVLYPYLAAGATMAMDDRISEMVVGGVGAG